MRQEPSATILWRAATPDDVDDLASLHQQVEADNDIPYRTSRDEIAHRFDDPSFDPRLHTRVAIDGIARMVASAWLMVSPPTNLKHRAIVLTAAQREYAELEVEALQWAGRAVREEFAGRADDLPRILRAFLELHETERIRLFEAEGYMAARYFVDMVRRLDVEIPAASVPDPISIEPWADRWIESAHSAHVEAFADHWGSLPPTLETWHHWVTAPNFRPDLSYVAIADGEVAAYALNGVYPDDFEARGRREGWIDTLGTRRQWRHRGLASALINRSMHAFADEGLDFAALGVDTANPTGAFGLYAALGFTEVSQSVNMVKELAR